MSSYDSRTNTWNEQLKNLCPSSPPVVVEFSITESTEVQCAVNTVSLNIKTPGYIPVGSTIIVDGLNAQP